MLRQLKLLHFRHSFESRKTILEPISSLFCYLWIMIYIELVLNYRTLKKHLYIYLNLSPYYIFNR